MEEIMSMIFQGVKLVKELESSLPVMSPESLSISLHAIAKAFDDANDRLKIVHGIKNSEAILNQSKHVVVASGSDQMLMQIEAGLMEEYWSRCGGLVSSHGTEAMIQRELMVVGADGGGRNLTVAESSSTPRKGKRKGEEEKTVYLVAALRTGNTDLPPDDSHTWRKYGQKEILGSRFPRAYYRCTHQKLYNCPAKKQVQRLNEDPFTFRVTYRGSHTCHIYSTAPTASAATPTVPTSSVTTTTGHSVEYGPVLDMADAMFGSGGIGANMDFIFPFNDPSSQHHHHFPRPDDGQGDQ